MITNTGVDLVVPIPRAADEPPKGTSLGDLLARVTAAIRRDLSGLHWVRAEILELMPTRSGHFYPKLVERDEAGRVLSQCNAAIWKDKAAGLDAKFAAATGEGLRSDIKVLLRVRVEFHTQHGFRLTIEDVDPSYTIGDLAARLARIRGLLEAEGVFGKNRLRPAPPDFTHVAVISPVGSAGLGDFKREAERLHHYGLCDFRYYAAAFQGAEASASIRGAARVLYGHHKNHRPFDALCIIRGGGSVTDLAWLNEHDLARTACHLPMPIFTGIGHERDSTILDEVAHTRFDTPSKVALHIAGTIWRNADTARSDFERVLSQARNALRSSSRSVEHQGERLSSGAAHAIGRARQDCDRRASAVRSSASYQLGESGRAVEAGRARLADEAAQLQARTALAVEGLAESVASSSRLRLEDAGARADRLSQQVRSGAGLALVSARYATESHARLVVGLGPGATLRRGFAIVRDADGRPVTNRESAAGQGTLDLEFRDGLLRVEVPDDHEGTT
jgi:exodeoxyribonuclease VII large subunit